MIRRGTYKDASGWINDTDGDEDDNDDVDDEDDDSQ